MENVKITKAKMKIMNSLEELSQKTELGGNFCKGFMRNWDGRNYLSTKSNGIGYLARLYQIPVEDIICFGDDYNDMDMLSFCGKGICVGNAVDAAKEIADEICLSNEEDGVAKWLDKMLLV